MKRLFLKRAFALLIDGFIFGCCYSLFFKDLVVTIYSHTGSWIFHLVFVPFFFKDVIFRNASIGKMIFGLRVFDNNWKKPGIWALIKRAVVMSTAGFVLYKILNWIKKDKLWFMEWELNTLKTRVIERKVYKKLKESTAVYGDSDPKIITELYDEYLRSGKILDVSALEQMESIKIKYDE